MPLTQQQRDNILLSQAGVDPTFSAPVYAIAATSRPRLSTEGVETTNTSGTQPIGQVLLAPTCVDLGRSYPRCVVMVSAIATATYTVTIAATPYAFSGTSGMTKLEILQGIANLINNDTLASAAIIAVVGETDPALLVTLRTAETVTYAVGSRLTLTDEANAVDFTLWLYVGGEWRTVNGGVVTGQTTSWTDWLFVGPATRAFVQVTATDGLVSWQVGLCKSVAS